MRYISYGQIYYTKQSRETDRRSGILMCTKFCNLQSEYHTTVSLLKIKMTYLLIKQPQ